MLKLQNYQNKKVGILGLGISGKATFDCLKLSGANIYLWDDKADQSYRDYLIEPNDPRWQEIDELIISPGIQHKGASAHRLIANLNPNCKIFCDVELFYRNLKASNKTIAITGTNGKSTTTALINHILVTCGIKSKICGNIGIAASSIEIIPDETYVIELSSYQLDKIIDAKFNIAVLTNITPDHLEIHGDMEHYICAKERIFSNNDFGIICIDNDICNSLYTKLANKNIIPVSKNKILSHGISMVNEIIYDNYFTNLSVKITQPITLSGEHNSENIICAIAPCLAYGLSLNDIIRSIDSFKSLEHRAEYVGSYNDVKYINDSKGTNFESTKHALNAFNNIHWILGGISKAGGIDGFEDYLSHLKYGYLIGTSQDEFAKSLDNKLPFIKCGDLQTAFAAAVKNAKPGDTILLSPACASTDQWKNFEERGKAFKEYFNKL